VAPDGIPAHTELLGDLVQANAGNAQQLNGCLQTVQVE
jgi:hypothetical protein